MPATQHPTSAIDGLNPQQRAAVEHPGGAQLILAGPGSGKTRVITQRIAWLVGEQRVAPWRILAVTFTNKAAREMRARAQDLLGEDAAKLHLGTFHSMCARWLRIHGKDIGLSPDYVIYDDADQTALMKRVLESLQVDTRQFTPRSVLSAISSAKSEMRGADHFKGQTENYFQEVVARAYERYQKGLRAASALDFDDLLTETVRLFRESEEALERRAEQYLHVLVDEFQDTNPAQYALARQLASVHGNVCVVGDPDQSIYSWRAADSRNTQYFQRDFPDVTTCLLEQNYRSTQPILDAASGVIENNRSHIERALWTERKSGQALTTYEAYNDEEEGEFVAREVERLATTNRPLGSIAVLYRTNAQSRPIEDALVRHRIPYRLIGGVRFYQRREIKDLIAYLRLVQNRLDEASLLRVINVPARGIGDTTMARLADYAGSTGLAIWDACEAAAGGEPVPGIAARAATAIRRFVYSIEAMRAERDRPLADLLDLVLQESGYAQYLRDRDEGGEERLENVLQLRTVMAQYEDTTGGEAGDLASFLQDVALVADVDELQGAVEAITLITLHAAKGLEFPVVFLVGMEEGVLAPHPLVRRPPADGGGATAGVRGHHPRRGLGLPDARLPALPGREAADERTLTLPRGDTRAPAPALPKRRTAHRARTSRTRAAPHTRVCASLDIGRGRGRSRAAVAGGRAGASRALRGGHRGELPGAAGGRGGGGGVRRHDGRRQAAAAEPGAAGAGLGGC